MPNNARILTDSRCGLQMETVNHLNKLRPIMQNAFKIVLICICLTVLPFAISAQKRYVYKPKASVFDVTVLKGKSLIPEYTDERSIYPKATIKCSFEDIQNAINETLKGTGATFLESGQVIKISLTSYETYFKGFVWIALTEYNVDIGGKHYQITKKKIAWNWWGTPTAKRLLQKSFNEANWALIELIHKLKTDEL